MDIIFSLCLFACPGPKTAACLVVVAASASPSRSKPSGAAAPNGFSRLCSAFAKHQRGNIFRVTLPIFRKSIPKEIFQKWGVYYKAFNVIY